MLLPFESYATARVDGALVALADSDEVALVRIGAGDATMERVWGRLVLGTTPLVATTNSAAGVVEMRDLTRGLAYRAPLTIGGIEWHERTTWRAADGALVRAVTSKTVQAASLHGYTPDTPTGAWRVSLDAGVADMAIAGDRVIVQLTDGRDRAALAAFDVRDSREVWRIPTRATFFDEGALAIAEGPVATVLANQAARETYEEVELHEVATGKLLRTVALTGPSIVRAATERGIRTEFGIAGDELWTRMHTLSFDVFHSGAARPATGQWAAALSACEWPMLLAPIADGLIAVRHDEQAIAITENSKPAFRRVSFRSGGRI